MEYILKTNKLSKHYKSFKAVDNVDLQIKKGDIYGFLGKNGAGKTTTIRMIMGLIKPTSGSVEMFGEKITTRNKIPFERIGSIIEFPGFYPNLSLNENLEVHRKLMGITDGKVIKETLELVGLADFHERKFKKLSLGMKQRMGLARALLNNPEILILDEPTNGLDPNGIKEIRRLILDLAEQRGITIIVSSHILSEVQQLASRVGIIHQGKLLKELNIDEIIEESQHYLEFKVNNDRKAALILEEKCEIKTYQIVEPGIIRIYNHLENSGKLNSALVEAGVEVRELVIQKENLEDYFLKLTGGVINE